MKDLKNEKRYVGVDIRVVQMIYDIVYIYNSKGEKLEVNFYADQIVLKDDEITMNTKVLTFINDDEVIIDTYSNDILYTSYLYNINNDITDILNDINEIDVLLIRD